MADLAPALPIPPWGPPLSNILVPPPHLLVRPLSQLPMPPLSGALPYPFSVCPLGCARSMSSRCPPPLPPSFALIPSSIRSS